MTRVAAKTPEVPLRPSDTDAARALLLAFCSYCDRQPQEEALDDRDLVDAFLADRERLATASFEELAGDRDVKPGKLVETLVEDDFLIDWPTGQPHPADAPHEYWLYVVEVRRVSTGPGKWREQRDSRMETIRGASRREADRKLRAFVKRKGVRVVKAAEATHA